MRVKIEIPIAEIDDPARSKSILGSFWQPRDPHVERIVEQHISVLASKRFQLLTKNEYGKYSKGGWQKELSAFISDVLVPAMPWHHALRRKPPQNRALVRAAVIVDRLAAEAARKLQTQFSEQVIPTDGAEYEKYCHQLLLKYGWRATLTKASGDQGVDILGQYEGYSVAFQCKRYDTPVGNKAVQEVASGRQFYGTKLAVVISSAGYTPAAKQLASATNVRLLHHADLWEFSKQLLIDS